MGASTEWKSWKLQKRSTIPLAIVDILLIVLILVLERISATRNGIASVPSTSTNPNDRFSATNAFWSYGILWTALPTFLMTLYRISWDAVVNATAERQPYVELARSKDQASSASRTIMLDYRAYPSMYNWYVAFRHKHHLLGICMILSVILSVALVPLTAHLLAASTTDFLSDIKVNMASAFNDGAVNVQTDLLAVMNVAAAGTIFGANTLPWSTAQYAFVPFGLKDNLTSGSVSANVTAYFSLLDCQIKSASDYQAENNGGSIHINGNDRGCASPSQLTVAVKAGLDLYMSTWSNLQCSADAHSSRFGILTASYSASAPNNLGNLTVLSCIPSYWETRGRLAVNLVPGKPPAFSSFAPAAATATEFRPLFAMPVEQFLPTYTIFDPSNTAEADAWGRLVYALAKQLNPSNPLASSTVKTAMETLYSSFFASLASTHLFQPAAPRDLDAQLTERATRLFVVSPVAWTVAVILALAFACNIFLILQSERTVSILQEEPKGLLGSAALLQDSDVSDLVVQLRGRPPQFFNVRETAKKRFSPDTSKCWYDADANRICVSGMQADSKNLSDAGEFGLVEP